MPICYVTISNSIGPNEIHSVDQYNMIRKIVAMALDSKSRLLDENHISLRIQHSERKVMLADIEIDVFAQFYWRRFFSRDKRANQISAALEKNFGYSCATWINLCNVGYSRVSKGQSYYSTKEDDNLLREIRKDHNKRVDNTDII